MLRSLSQRDEDFCLDQQSANVYRYNPGQVSSPRDSRILFTLASLRHVFQSNPLLKW